MEKKLKMIKKKLKIFIFLLILTLFPLISSVTIGDQTIIFSSDSSSTIIFEQNTQLTKLVVNETALEIYNVVSDGAIFTNTNQTSNARIGFYDVPIRWSIIDITNNLLLFTSQGVGYIDEYYVIFEPNVQIQITSDPTITTPGSGHASEPFPSFPLPLYSLNITTKEEWIFDETYFIYITPLTKNNEITNLSDLSVNIIENISYEGGEISKMLNGIYKIWFIIPYQSTNNITLQNFSVEIIASLSTKEITKIVNISLKEGTTIEKIKHRTENIFVKIGNFIEMCAYKFIQFFAIILWTFIYKFLYLFIILILAFIGFIIFLFYKQNKKKNLKTKEHY